MRWILLFLLPATVLMTPPIAGQPLQPPKPETTAPKKTKPESAPSAAMSADQMIAEALKNNPDIRVADAKVREAEAEAHRTRMKVAAEVGALVADIEAGRAAEKDGLNRYERVKVLVSKGVASIEELENARFTHAKLKAELAAKEARLPFLLGRQPGASGPQGVIDDLIRKKWLDSGKAAPVSDEEFLRRVMLDLYGRLPTPAETKDFLKLPEKDRREKWLDQAASPKTDRLSIRHDLAAWVGASCIQCHTAPARLYGTDAWMNHHDVWAKLLADGHAKTTTPATEKLRKILDTKVGLDLRGHSAWHAIAHVRDKILPGINVSIRAKLSKTETSDITLADPVPVGAVLQYLEDELNIVFVLRDYGIVVVGADDRAPPGAVRVVDFWKHGKTPPAAESKDKANPSEKTKASEPEFKRAIVRGNDGQFRTLGVIERIDAKDASLFEISAGSGDGIAKGEQLHVFRLQPEAKYLGRAEVVEVKSKTSIARRIEGVPDALQPGDQVATRIEAAK